MLLSLYVRHDVLLSYLSLKKKNFIIKKSRFRNCLKRARLTRPPWNLGWRKPLKISFECGNTRWRVIFWPERLRPCSKRSIKPEFPRVIHGAPWNRKRVFLCEDKRAENDTPFASRVKLWRGIARRGTHKICCVFWNAIKIKRKWRVKEKLEIRRNMVNKYLHSDFANLWLYLVIFEIEKYMYIG